MQTEEWNRSFVSYCGYNRPPEQHIARPSALTLKIHKDRTLETSFVVENVAAQLYVFVLERWEKYYEQGKHDSHIASNFT